jgi:hypothetical protein
MNVSGEGTHILRKFITPLLFHMHQKKVIALEIAKKSVNGPFGKPKQIMRRIYLCKSVNGKNEKILKRQSNDSFNTGHKSTVLIRIFRALGSLARWHFC